MPHFRVLDTQNMFSCGLTTMLRWKIHIADVSIILPLLYPTANLTNISGPSIDCRCIVVFLDGGNSLVNCGEVTYRKGK